MWLRNVQDVLIRFDTYIIHPEDVQIVSEKLCDLRSFPASWGPMKQASIQAFLTALSASASILSRSIFGFAKPKVKKQKRHEVTVTGARCFFFILLKWYVDICCIYIYIHCFHSFELPRDDIIASAERQCLKKISCDYKLSQLSEPCQKARKGREQLLWMSFNNSNHVSKQPLQAEQSRKTSA